MNDYYSRETSKTRARRRLGRIVRIISFVAVIAILATAGAFAWHQRLAEREMRASASWHSLKETPRSDVNDLEIVVPSAEAPTPAPAPATAATVAAAPRSVGPSLKNRSGVTSLFFSERELVPLDINGQRLSKQEELFIRQIAIPTAVNVNNVK
jgi:hypothetical protein